MKKNKQKWLLAIMLILCFGIGIFCIFVSAEEETLPDAMTDILSSEALAKYNAGTYEVKDDGYLGIPVTLNYFYDSETFGDSQPGVTSTPLIMYVVNTRTTRTGTDTDVEIITSMVARGYIVAVADYKNHAKAIPDDIEWSVATLVKPLLRSEYLPENSTITNGTYEETLIVPAGHNVSRDHTFWEIDKHSVDGTLEQIVRVWNADFRQYKGNYVIPWTYANGTRKPTQTAFDNTEPVWYCVGTGEGAIEWQGVSYVPDAENGTYMLVKHTKATKISDCVKPDGTPIDFDLGLHVVYPTNPEADVPVMTLASSSQSLGYGATQIARSQHMWGFAFEGYAVAVYDYLYVPMAFNDHYGYFDGSSGDGKSVTGDNMTYSLYTYNMAFVPTAALRYIRRLGLSDHDTFRFNGQLGVIGNSKASNITQLADLDLQNTKSLADGYTKETLEQYAHEYICSFPQHYYIIEHHGETRFDGDYSTYTDEGMTIDAGERQPWLTYDGEMISSGADFVYCSCGAINHFLDENYGPLFTCGHIDDETNGYTVNNEMINYAREYNLPLVWFEISEGHTYVGRYNAEHNVDPYVVFKNWANYVLADEAPKVAYLTPLSDFEISATPSFTVKFSAIVTREEAAKIHLLDKNGNKIYGVIESAYGNTEWTFTPSPLAGGAEYTLVIPADLKAENGKALGQDVRATHYVEQGQITALDRQESGIIPLTVPTLADYIRQGANRAELRLYVSNDAHNILDAYILESANAIEGTYADSVNVGGAGYYTLDLTDTLAKFKEGATVYVMVKNRNTEAPATVVMEDFEDGSHGFATRGMAPTKIIEENGNKILQAHISNRTGGAGHAYYATNEFLRDDDYILPYVTLADYGRRFTVSFDIKDTVARDLNIKCTSRSDVNTGVIDYDAVNYNVRTNPQDGWVTVSFDIVIRDTDYGKNALGAKGIVLLLKPSGNTDARIYLDNFTLTEHYDLATVESATLALVNAGGSVYQVPKSDLPYAVGDRSYATLAEALSHLDESRTVTLLSNVTLTDTSVITANNITLDLAGYTIRTSIREASLISLTESGTINLKNGSLYLSGGSLVGFENAEGTVRANVILDNVDVGAEKGAMVNRILVNTATDASVSLSLTICDGTIDMRYESYCKNPLTLLPKSTDNLTLTCTVKGGSLFMTRQHKMRLSEDSSELIFEKNEEGQYPVFYYTASRTLGANTLIKADDGFRFLSPAPESNRNGFLAFLPETNELCTPYGIIPEEYASVESYPFVVFNLAENTFLGASNIFAADQEGALALLFHKTQGKYAVYMRRDFTHSVKAFWNFAFLGAETIIDLGGHTLTNAAGSSAMFIAQSKRANNTDVTIKNGTICSAKNAPIIDFRAGSQKQNYIITFDNVNFTVQNGVTLTTWVKTTHTSTQNPYTGTVVVKNCTFDLTNITSSVTLFTLGNSDGSIIDTVRVIGSDLKGDVSKVTLSQMNGENSTFSLEKDAQGNYLTNTRLTTAAKPVMSVVLEGKTMTFSKAISTVGDYTSYALAYDALATPYGVIPDTYTDVSTYPILVFDGSGTIVHSATTMDGALGTLIAKTGTYAIYVRQNVANTATQWDFGKTNGNITIDLNGNLLTLNKGFLHAQAKSNSALTVTVKNGTIAVGNANVWSIGAKSYATNKVMNVTFDHIEFTSFGTGLLVVDNQEGGTTATSNVTFNDCIFEVGSSRTTPLIQIGTFESISVNVRIHGGMLITDGKNIPAIFSIGTYMANKSILFAKGSDGKYLSVTTALSTLISDGVKIPTTDGERYFIKSRDTDIQSTFTLGEKTKYGYIPEEYLDSVAYPIVVFNVDTGALVFIPATLSGEGATSAFQYCVSKGGNHAIFVRSDIKSSDCNYKLGDLNGTMTLDLNGCTLELAKPLFFLQGRDVKYSVIRLLNGTVVQNGSSIIALGGRWGNGKKTNDVLVENVNFTNMKGYLVVDKEYDTVITTTNITFRDCRFELSGASEFIPVTLGMLGDNVRVSVNFVGGEFILGGTHTEIFHIDGAYIYKKVTFDKNAEGKYPTITLNGVSASTYLTPDGTPIGLRVVEKSGISTIYALSPITIVSAYLNIANDLNFIYRVYLPEGLTNPTMTFRVGEKSETVTALGKDENGYYLFAVTKIGPHKMGDIVYATVSASAGGNTYTATNNTLSIKRYAQNLLDLYPTDTALSTLVEKLLAYGAASQLYMNYNTDALVAPAPTPDAIPSTVDSITLEGEASDRVAFSACGLYLGTEFALRVSLKGENFDGLTLVAMRGDNVTTYDLSTYTVKDGIVTVYYENLTAAALDEKVTFYVVNTSDNISLGKTLTFSANAYLYCMKNTENTSLQALTRTIYAFGVAAEAYSVAQNNN